MLLISVLQPSEISGVKSESQSAGNFPHLTRRTDNWEDGYSIRDKVTRPMSQAELSWCMAPPFTFTHYLCINAAGWPIPRGSKTADTLLRRRLQMCTYVAAGLAPVSPWRDGSTSMQTFPCPISGWGWFCELQGPVVAPELLSEVFARLVQDLVRWGPGGSLSRDNRPLWLRVGACGHPGFEEEGCLPMAVPTPILELHFGFILDFGKGASNLWYRWQRKKRKALIPFFLYFIL